MHSACCDGGLRIQRKNGTLTVIFPKLKSSLEITHKRSQDNNKLENARNAPSSVQLPAKQCESSWLDLLLQRVILCAEEKNRIQGKINIMKWQHELL